MQPVIRILSLKTLRIFWVAGQFIEIDDPVERTALSNPFVHGLAHSLMPERIPSVALGWGDGSAIYLDAFCLGFCYQHLVAGYQGICYMFIISSAATDIVGSFEDDEFIHTSLSQNVTVETLHGRFAQSAFHYAVATDTKIQYTVWLLCIQGIREEIGPSVLMVSGTSTAISDRVSEDSHHRSSLIGLHING